MYRIPLNHIKFFFQTIGEKYKKRNPPKGFIIAGKKDGWPNFRPSRVCLEASTVCQLKCPSCPRADGSVQEYLGNGFLSENDFLSFINDNEWIKRIELSNWGEIFLNPELVAILKHAHDNSIATHASNGVNLNNASETCLEAIVKYKMRSLACSIDGATNETYSTYRVNGNLDKVIFNIARINQFKKLYGSSFPELTWQFVIFGHNEHEIGLAKEKAKELGMNFYLKLSWGGLYNREFSPVINRGFIKQEISSGVADREEYEKKYGRNYVAGACLQLWQEPRINYDGKLLGCSLNYWSDYGNVFEDGLEDCLKGEKMRYARKMVTGRVVKRDDIPCCSCKIYHGMKKRSCWVKVPSIEDK